MITISKVWHQLCSGCFIAVLITIASCTDSDNHEETNATKVEVPEYFSLRPEIEKTYGYSHAVKIGNEIKISGAVSMDDAGNPIAAGDLLQQMKNCYADLD